MTSTPVVHSSGSRLREALPYVGLGVGVWAALSPYVLLGADLNVQGSKEVADHVIPGVLIIGLSLAVLLRGRDAAPSGGVFPLVAGFGVLLAGLWMTATHLPLVSDARKGFAHDDVAAWHTAPGLVVLALGLLWAALYWSSAGAESTT